MDGSLTPTVIKSNPIPLLSTNTDNLSQVDAGNSNTPNATDNGITPQTIQAVPISGAPISIDVVSISLDTQQRLILGTFQFGQVGAIQIGTYVFGVSGQINLSPTGITAKNVNGTTTFTLDGTTGNATFLGTLQAGTLIAGDSSVVIGIGGSGGGRILLTNAGVPTIIIGDPS